MSDPCIITVAITGSVPTKADNPAVPITVAEQIESTHAAFEAGAALVHVHVRNEDGTTSSDPERFARFGEGVRRVVICKETEAMRPDEDACCEISEDRARFENFQKRDDDDGSGEKDQRIEKDIGPVHGRFRSG